MKVFVSVRDLWRINAAFVHYGICEDCGDPATVARQERAHKFQCLACFAASPTGSPDLRRRVRDATRAQQAANTSTVERLESGRATA